MKNNPLAIVCIFFCLGIWIAKLVLVYEVCSIYHCENCTRIISEGNFLDIPLFFVYTSCVLFLVTALMSLQRQFLFFLSLGLAVFLAGFIHLQNVQTYPANHIANFVSGSPQEAYLGGKVVTSPEVSQTFYHSKKSAFIFQVYDLKVEETWHALQGLIKVSLYGRREPHYGDELLLGGLLDAPPGLRNPGGFDYRAYLANQNIFATLIVKEKDAFKLLSADKRFSFTRSVFKLKQRLSRIIFENLNPPQAALLSAILLGERSRLGQDVKDLFINTGTIHILATQYTKNLDYSTSCYVTL